jgi:N-acyl homoserine lactone hydrolase
MRIHALETGKVSIKEEQRRARSDAYPLRVATTMVSRHWTEPLPILAWVIEHDEGLIVVDTGETVRAMGPGYFPAWHPYPRFAVKFDITDEQQIDPLMKKAGLSTDDVRWVVITHLHTDHAGGLHSFPRAEVLVTRREYDTATGLGGRIAGYLPNRWPGWFAPRLVDHTGPALGGFDSSLRLTKAADVHLVPTFGHTPGHQSVIVNDGDRQVFIAGDTSYDQESLLAGAVDGVCPSATRARQVSQVVRSYLDASGAAYLPTHDPNSERRLAAEQA